MRLKISVILVFSLSSAQLLFSNNKNVKVGSVDDEILELIGEGNYYNNQSEQILDRSRSTLRTAPKHLSPELKDINSLSGKIIAEGTRSSLQKDSKKIDESESSKLKKSLGTLHPNPGFSSRLDSGFSGKANRLAGVGFPQGTIDTIESGLKWLKSKQKNDGSWGRGLNDTCLALLPFLGHCEIENSTSFGETFKRGINFVKSHKTEKNFEYYTTGEFYKHAGSTGDLLTHALRTIVLAEYYVLTKKSALVEDLRASVDGIINTQGTGKQWVNSYLAHFNIQALHALTFTKIRNKEILECMTNYANALKKSIEPRRYSPQLAGDIFALQLCKRGHLSVVKEGLEIVTQKSTFDLNRPDICYFETNALYQSTAMGSVNWRKWKGGLKVKEIIGLQLLDGGWTVTDPSNAQYADLETSVFTLLVLQTPYRCLPTTPKPDKQKSFWGRILD